MRQKDRVALGYADKGRYEGQKWFVAKMMKNARHFDVNQSQFYSDLE